MESNYKIFKYCIDSDTEVRVQSEIYLVEVSKGIFSFEKNRFCGDSIVAGTQDVINMLNREHKVAVYIEDLIITNFKLIGDK